jgi:hypothetical protein
MARIRRLKVKKLSAAKARATAKEIHRLAAADPDQSWKRIRTITPEMTPSGSGAIRFRAQRIIEEWRKEFFRPRRSLRVRPSR